MIFEKYWLTNRDNDRPVVGSYRSAFGFFLEAAQFPLAYAIVGPEPLKRLIVQDRWLAPEKTKKPGYTVVEPAEFELLFPTEWAVEIETINDDPGVSREQKKTLLMNLFRKQGIVAGFVLEL